jgi:hypothetical protein
MEDIPIHVMLLVLGDLNARVGSDNKGGENIMDREDVGKINKNGKRLCDLCQDIILSLEAKYISASLFTHTHKKKIMEIP